MATCLMFGLPFRSWPQQPVLKLTPEEKEGVIRHAFSEPLDAEGPGLSSAIGCGHQYPIQL